MKKEYVKPFIVVESFQLDAAIAAGCSLADGKYPLNYNLHDCTLEEEAPGLNYFGQICIHNIEDEGDGNDQICYHGPLLNYKDVALNS